MFETLKESRLKMTSLPLINCFNYTNVLQNSVNALAKLVLKSSVFVKKLKFCAFQTILFGSNFASMLTKYVSNNVWRDFRLPVSSFATVVGKRFNGKFTAKIDFPILCDHYWRWHWKSKFSSQIFGPHAGEIWTKSYGTKYTKCWAFWEKNGWPRLRKCWRHFWTRFCDINNCLILKY